ncbi:MAG TPA: N-acetylglucosamine-6-phosphate deacetylase [Capillimicrobium sp.]|nr:N-acetylglucosamine-6-phosphate deacetylase [Capillimicrobium sp.]
MRLGVAAALVDGERIAGDVSIEDGVVTAVGLAGAPRDGTLAVPGYVDNQVNGMAGHDFLATDLDGYAEAGAAMAATGVVAYQPTLITSAVEAYREPLRVATEAAARPGGPIVAGVHLEGPFLSPSWPGAHDPANLRPPDLRLTEQLLGWGTVTTMTLAPELPGALELIDRLAAAGVVVSCGHSDADAAQAHAAYDRGARAVTHLYNAHRRWQPRDPGLGGVALVRPDVTVQVIFDDVHLARESGYAAFLAAGRRFALVTDAMEAATLPPGRYTLGTRTVDVEDGSVRLADGTLAGSLLTMDEAVRKLVDAGASLADAVHAASTAPARLLGRDDLGALRPGAPAHLAVLDEELRVVRTLVGGREIART